MFHRSNYGSFGSGLPTDQNGYVPQASDGPWDLHFDHGTERTHDEQGELTPYGEWWEEEGFPALVEQAIAATEQAEQGLATWRTDRE